MIISTDDLGGLTGSVTMVDGGFDPIHPGHVEYFRVSAELGYPVLCNVSGDSWVSRKHPPLLDQAERGAVIDAIRWVTYTHLAAISTAEVVRRLRPAVYAKGADWRDRLPEDELEACSEVGTRIVILETVLASSSEIVSRFTERLARRPS